MVGEKLVFVYNADSGVLNALADSWRKLVGADDGCSLCRLTHGMAGPRPAWRVALRDALADTGARVEVLHRDEFCARYGDLTDGAPVIYAMKDGSRTLVMGPAEIAGAGLEDLIRLLGQERT